VVSADDLVEANRAIRRLSADEVASLWATLDLEDVEATKVALLRVMPSIVFKYGDMAAAIAADLYDEWRSTVREAGKYRALMADIADVSKVEASTRYAVGGLYRDPMDAASVLALLQSDVVERHSLNAGRETIALNVQQDPARPRWARVPVGVTCKWCLMLGSRGFKPGLGYRSEITAAAGSHGNCDCILAPEFATGDLIESYDPDAVYDEWKAAEAADKAAKAAHTSQR
jgi:hypothetical protein